MKRVIIIHCWDGYSDYCWYQWVKQQLEQKGFFVDVPNMPNTNAPDLKNWLSTLNELIKEPNEDLFLVGHSIGCITILRYLESLNTEEKIGGAVLVAGFTDNLGYKELENFFTTPIDFEKIKKHCNRFATIHSDNDPYVPLKHIAILEKALGAQSIVKHNANHFSGERDNEKSCTQLNEVVFIICDWENK